MNTITIELCKEDRARLDAIIEGLSKLTTHNCHNCVESAVQMAVTVAKDPDNVDPAYTGQPAPAEHPIDATTEHLTVVEPAATEEPPAPEAPKPVTLKFADFQGLISKVLAEGKCTKPQLREHMAEVTYIKDGKECRCTKLSDIPEDRRAEFLERYGVQV